MKNKSEIGRNCFLQQEPIKQIMFVCMRKTARGVTDQDGETEGSGGRWKRQNMCAQKIFTV